MSYRKFWIVNSKDERWNLTEHDLLSFLNNPAGLGLKKAIDSVRYGERAVKTSETYNIPAPSGELLFYDTENADRYMLYNQFCRFIMDTPLVLHYQTPNNHYTLDCEVTDLTKTETKDNSIMTCNITFSALGFWEGDPVTITGTGSTYTITNNSDYPVGFEITVEGSLTNPYFTLEQDGELYGEAKFDDATAFDSVYVNSNDGEQNIVLYQSSSILPNPLAYQDLSISNGSIYVTFVKLARGESTLTIGMDSGSISNVTVVYTPQYRSV